MDPKKLKKSPTWPYVSAFTLAMEQQLDRHRERGDRPGWMGASPDELFQALLEQTQKASELLMRVMMNPPAVPPEVKAELLKHLAHAANFAMMVADCTGALAEPSPEDLLLTHSDAIQGLNELRLAIGANRGEDTIDALHRYTFAVQLGCALKLERRAKDLTTSSAAEVIGALSGTKKHLIVAALIGGAALLRDGLPAHVYGEKAPGDAITRWREEQTQAIKDGWLGAVFDRFWSEAMGGVPSDAARARLRQLLEEFEPGEAGEEGAVSIPGSGVAVSGVTDDGRADGCLDSMCGDCDMK